MLYFYRWYSTLYKEKSGDSLLVNIWMYISEREVYDGLLLLNNILIMLQF